MSYNIYTERTEAATPGKTLFLLGQSTDGPVNEPIPVRNPKDAAAIFASGNLLDAYEQVKDIPSIQVHLMRISGEYARLSLIGETNGNTQPVLTFRATSAGDRYNDVGIHVGTIERDGQPKEALIIASASHAVNARSYILEDYRSLQDLARQVNRDAFLKRGHVSVAVADTAFPLSELHLLNSDIVLMKGGANGEGLTKDELYIALDESYSVLEGRAIDVLCPYPVRVDDIHPSVRYGDSRAAYGEARYGQSDYLALVENDRPDYPMTFHEQLIDFCRTQERFGLMTHGVLGLRENPKGDRMSAHYVARLVSVSAFRDRYGLTEYRSGQYIDKGYRVSVFAQDIRYGGQVQNGCAMYAGMIAQIEASETTTNRQIPAGIELAFELSPAEIRILSEVGVVAARRSVRKGIVITNGVTAGLPGTPYHLVGNIRMLQFTLLALNRSLDDLLGEPYVPNATLREIERRCEAVLEDLKGQSVLKDHGFTVELDSRSMRAVIEVSLQPRYSVEHIKATSVIEFAASGGDS